MLNRIDGRTSTLVLPSWPLVVAERVRVMVGCWSWMGGASRESTAPSTAAAVTMEETAIEDSVDRLPGAATTVVAVVAGAVAAVATGVVCERPNGGGREPRGWVRTGTSENRLDRDTAVEVEGFVFAFAFADAGEEEPSAVEGEECVKPSGVLFDGDVRGAVAVTVAVAEAAALESVWEAAATDDWVCGLVLCWAALWEWEWEWSRERMWVCASKPRSLLVLDVGETGDAETGSTARPGDVGAGEVNMD